MTALKLFPKPAIRRRIFRVLVFGAVILGRGDHANTDQFVVDWDEPGPVVALLVENKGVVGLQGMTFHHLPFRPFEVGENGQLLVVLAHQALAGHTLVAQESILAGSVGHEE